MTRPQSAALHGRRLHESFHSFIDLLQDRDRFIGEIIEGVDLGSKLKALFLVAALTLATYGAIIGVQHSLMQAVSSAMKLPLLFLLTNLICLPTLFVFGSFFGSKRSLSQITALLLAGTAMMGIVLVGFAPVTLFFTITTRDYVFLKLLSVAFFAVAGMLGVFFFNRFLVQSMDTGAQPIAARTQFLRFWFLLYGFVGTQLAWTLRPFFGSPDEPFAFFRGLGGNFYANVLESLGHLFGR